MKKKASILIVIVFIFSALHIHPAVPFTVSEELASEIAALDQLQPAEDWETSGDIPIDIPIIAKHREHTDTWIIRWEDEIDPEFLEQSVITGLQDFLQVTIAKPRDGVELEAWIREWSESPSVKYMQPNHQVETAATPNDPERENQRYLNLIGAYAAWDHVTSNTSLTIAVVDTGVDLNHPDLRRNLVSGYNFIDRGKPPQDDNGHGTNVAGVIAAVGNNRIGTTGILWNAKIMPLKALDKTGFGNEDKLGEAIRYAVDNGAKIVVMSLGLHRYSPYLQDIVDYAERNGVLLVAAAGNEGNNVKYPAAYPTVLAVGGIGLSKSIIQESNYGPELDLVASWEVYSTALGGGYKSNYGTSMAAPQVAAVAAMVWAKHRDWEPAQVRNLLRQTAEDISLRGWDERTGYGIVRADRALTATYSGDMYEPNNNLANATRIPVEHYLSAELSGRTDEDWFYVEPKYNGTLSVNLTSSSGRQVPIRLDHYDRNGRLLGSYSDIAGKQINLPVTNARNYLRLTMAESAVTASISYKLKVQFTIYKDRYEDNDRQYKAYRLPAQSQVITGTFHKQNDFDWFQIPITQEGTLRIKMSTDTARIDPAIVVQRQGGAPITTDDNDEGETEYTDPIEVTPGTYYLLFKNVISDTTYAVAGEYQVTIEYTPKFVDPNEPNDKPYQAVMMAPGMQYNGVIDDESDEDWFTFILENDAVVDLKLERIPHNRTMSLSIYDSAQKMLAVYNSKLGTESMDIRSDLDRGLYYVRLTASSPFQDQMYGLTVNMRQKIAGFIDIEHNWAREAIVSLVEQQIVRGYGDYTFRPEAPLMRSEAIAMIVRAFGLTDQQGISYPDVPANHWAGQDIARAVKAGIATGYPDGTFRPDRYITRVEMAQMLGNALQLEPLDIDPGFRDIPDDYWASGMLAALKQSKTLTGYPDGTFRPNNTASRAEFANLLYKALQQ